jgi:glutamine synthetase
MTVAAEVPDVPSPSAFAELSAVVRSRGLRFAEFWFTDLPGRPWRITMPASALTEELFRTGLPLDGQPVGGSWDGVMILQPRYDAVYADPTASAPSLVMFCDLLSPETRAPLALEPRHVLERASRALEERLGASAVIGAEPEFLLLDGGKPAAETVVWEFLRAVALALGEAGVQVDWFRTGPAPGQGRVQMRAGPALQMADRVMLYRHLAGNLARARRLTAAFLPRPVEGGGTPGLPVHQALWAGGRNLFHDESGWSKTSALCRRYAGGLLSHLPALAAFCAPTTNSYRRLIRGVSGPTRPVLSASDRQAVCRIPARSDAPAARRVKFWLPDPTANPYLALAAILLAGLDGAENGAEAPCEGGAAPGPGVPHSLEEALDGLGADRAFLKAGDAFSDEMIDAWIQDRWARQILPVRAHPHPRELSELSEGGIS